MPDMVDFSPKEIKYILRNFYNHKQLGEHPLAQLNVVTRHLQSIHAVSNVENRGLALAIVLEQLIIAGSSRNNHELSEWKILQKSILEGKPQKEIGGELSICLSTVSRYKRLAHVTLSKALMASELNLAND